jgi:uncharacterized membrane protein
MSLDTGRKLGLVASIIAVIGPVLTIVLYGVLVFSALSSALSDITGGQSATNSLTSGFFTAAIVLTAVIGFVGIILFLIGMHSLSEYYNEPGIFRNALYSFLTGIIGVVVLIVVIAAFAIGSIASGGSSTLSTVVSGILGFLLIVFLGALVISIISAIFARNAFKKLGETSGVSSFNTAGLLYLIGGILSIVLIGSILIWIAWIFALGGFNALRPKPAEVSQPIVATPSPQVSMNNTNCPFCSAMNAPDAIYCANCGRQLH